MEAEKAWWVAVAKISETRKGLAPGTITNNLEDKLYRLPLRRGGPQKSIEAKGRVAMPAPMPAVKSSKQAEIEDAEDQKQKNESPSTTPLPVPPPVGGDNEEKKKKKRRARRMALLAGYYQINGTLEQIEDLVVKSDLDPLTPAIYGRVWSLVMAGKDDPRFKALLAYMSLKSDLEPAWLAPLVAQAEQELTTVQAQERELTR
jgi:hypothetical protein